MASLDKARAEWNLIKLTQKQKSRRKAAFPNLKPEHFNYAKRNAVLFLRRYAMKPRPAKPRIIIAQVAGSGTAEMLRSPVLVPALVRVICASKVSENGLTPGAKGSVALPEYAAVVKGPREPIR